MSKNSSNKKTSKSAKYLASMHLLSQGSDFSVTKAIVNVNGEVVIICGDGDAIIMSPQSAVVIADQLIRAAKDASLILDDFLLPFEAPTK